MGDSLPGPMRPIVPEFNSGSGMKWISSNSGRVVGDVEFWGSSEGTSGVPEARLGNGVWGGGLSPSSPATGKAALILLSQAEDVQA